MTTVLHPTGLPGKPWTFSPKDPAPGGGKPSTQVTQLSVLGCPGRIQSSSPKDPPGGGTKPSTQITTLSVLALPGQLRTFVAKSPSAPAGRYPDRLIALGFQGTINDMEYAYLRSLGFTNGNKQDAKRQHLENLGYSGSLNDMLKQKADAEGAQSISRMMQEQGIIPV